MTIMFRVLLAAIVGLLFPAFVSAKDQIHTFKKLRLTDQFWSEGANFGDFNHDGKMDIVSGPYWYEGPDLKKRHEFCPANATFKKLSDRATSEVRAALAFDRGTLNLSKPVTMKTASGPLELATGFIAIAQFSDSLSPAFAEFNRTWSREWTLWGSDEAVLLLWQADYDTPLIPGSDRRTALRLEKAIERLAMLPVDFADQPDQQVRRARTLLAALARDGVQPCDERGQPIDVLNL